MQILVYDDGHRAKALKEDTRWLRWTPTATEAWKEGPEGTYVASKSAGEEWSELHYQHLVPDSGQWEAALAGTALPRAPRPTLITDFYSYNTNVTTDSYSGDGSTIQPHWVSDLTVSMQLKVESSTGRLRFVLVEGGVPNRCEIDVATGEAVMTHGDAVLSSALTSIKGPGTYEVAFANVDDRLTLWVDGRTPFGEGLEYGNESADTIPVPTAADLKPVAVATRGAAVSVSGLVLKRDIYYTLEPGMADYDAPWDRYSSDPAERNLKFFDLLANPADYAALAMHQPRDYPLGPARYMMMGDNSPRSKDGRGWTRRDADWDPSGRESWEVPESLLIGKAFFVYWPHGKPFGPNIAINRDFRIPFRPYFERMKWIR
jgi:signal peptidase I